MDDLESIGLIKFDILAIAALTTIRDATDQIESTYGIKIDIENLPLDDRSTLDLYRSGRLNGVFQCESYGMQNTMREIGVDRFDDVMAAVALFRPGPMESIAEYVARKKGEKRVEYFHPTIEPFVKEYLEKTYGVLVYQEQVMQIVNSLAGFSISDGYVMIKSIGKKKLHLMEKFEKQFIAGGVDKGVPEEVIRQYWSKFIVPFANYGFNAAHCLSGDMRVRDKKTGNFYTVEELARAFNPIHEQDYPRYKYPELVVDSYVDGELVEDKLMNVFPTGNKEVYEVELSNGMELECTMKHKFYCTDGEEHELGEIIEKDLEILCEETEDKDLIVANLNSGITTGVTTNGSLEQKNDTRIGDKDC